MSHLKNLNKKWTQKQIEILVELRKLERELKFDKNDFCKKLAKFIN